MTRIEAIARLRELADKLEAATDAPHDEHDGFYVTLDLHDHYADAYEKREATVNYWITALGYEERAVYDDFCCYRSDNGRTNIFCHNPSHQPPADLLANREVTLIECQQAVEIGGDE
jgi:hypothetical protein